MVVCSVDVGVDSTLLSDLEITMAAGKKNSSLSGNYALLTSWVQA